MQQRNADKKTGNYKLSSTKLFLRVVDGDFESDVINGKLFKECFNQRCNTGYLKAPLTSLMSFHQNPSPANVLLTTAAVLLVLRFAAVII